MPLFYMVAAVVIAGYIAFVVRAFKRGTLSFKANRPHHEWQQATVGGSLKGALWLS